MQPASYRETVVVNLPEGLHMRPITLIARLARQSGCEVRLFKGDQGADAKNPMEMLTLNAPQGTTLVLETNGENAREVMDTLLHMFHTNFEDAGEAPADRNG